MMINTTTTNNNNNDNNNDNKTTTKNMQILKSVKGILYPQLKISRFCALSQNQHHLYEKTNICIL